MQNYGIPGNESTQICNLATAEVECTKVNPLVNDTVINVKGKCVLH